MGGLARMMPLTARMFLVGAIAICGLPPLNGFVGKLFLYVAAFMNGITAELPLLALVAPVLALVGGLAVITFVKLYGIIFLGLPRSAGAAHSHEAGPLMILPMALLALGCLVAGMAPRSLVWLVTPAIGYFSGFTAGRIAPVIGRVPLEPLAYANIMLVVLVVLLWLAYRLRLRHSAVAGAPTWGCGYLEPTPRMQYTGTSFSEIVVNLLGIFALPYRQKPRIAGITPTVRSRFGYDAREAVLDRLLLPLFNGIGLAFSYVRRLQHGHIHIYMLYIFATLFVLMIARH
jgi:hydrogenase-4 component B